MIIAVGRIIKENNLIGIRIFDTDTKDTKETKDIRIEDKDKIKIKNLKSLNKLGIVDNKQEDKPIINLGEKDNKYLTVDINGNTKILNSLEGYNSIDLLTNIEQYEKYIARYSLIDAEPYFKFEVKEETDEVIITEYIENNEEFRIIEIPTFITGIKIGLNGGLKVNSPFKGVKQNLKVIYKCNKRVSMKGMFNEYKGSKLDLSNFDTSKVTNMSDMFEHCNKLKELDLSKFDTSKVTDMNGMFYACSSLKELDLSKFDTSKVTNMCCMFGWCRNLKELDLSNFDTSQVTDMRSMFKGCEKLEKLDISNFNTSKVTDMRDMFMGSSLTPENTGLKVRSDLR